jgi:aspartate-semialdehyde dehydrogenase
MIERASFTPPKLFPPSGYLEEGLIETAMNPLLRERHSAGLAGATGRSPRRTLRVAIVGGTGAVGSTVRKVLEERSFPIGDLTVFTSPRSAGGSVEFAGKQYPCQLLSEEAIQGFDIAICAAGSAVTREWAEKFRAAGAVFIDKSSELRGRQDVPLVVPEVNPDALAEHKGLVASPNCSTIQLVVAVNPIFQQVGIERIVVSTYQSVSGTGHRAEEELERQSRAFIEKRPIESSVYPHQIAFNVIPQVEIFKGDLDGADGYSTEEQKIANETRRILIGNDPEAPRRLKISATCARVPVVISHSESINIQTRDELAPEDCRALLAESPGLKVVDEPASSKYPMPIEAAGRDEVLVGRIRRDPSHDRCLNLWVVGDNLRKGAATNAVQIAEKLIEDDRLN